MKKARKIYFDKGNDVPNSDLPVLLFRSVLASQASGKADTFRRTFKKNGWARSLD